MALEEDMRILSILKACHFCGAQNDLISVRIEAPPGIQATSYLACPQHRTKEWQDHFEELWVIQERQRITELQRIAAQPTLEQRAEKWLSENPDSTAFSLVREMLQRLNDNEDGW